MKIEDKRELTAPCGLACFICGLYEENITDEVVDSFAQKGIPADEVPCKGCRAQDGKHFHLSEDGCATLDCAKAKGVEICSDCSEFPCALLAPLADQAAEYPHNFKLYNLCRIRLAGLDHWIEEEAALIRKAYFSRDFVVGKGQAE
jgi:hypothetical protein